MEKEFVPYEQALALKELGFDEPCFGNYDSESEDSLYLFKEGFVESSNKYYDYEVSAPLYQQAFRWFREKYSIQSTIEPTKDHHRFELGFNYWIWDTKTGEEWFTEPKNRPSGDWVYETYEESQLACLKKLIEISKEK